MLIFDRVWRGFDSFGLVYSGTLSVTWIQSHQTNICPGQGIFRKRNCYHPYRCHHLDVFQMIIISMSKCASSMRNFSTMSEKKFQIFVFYY